MSQRSSDNANPPAAMNDNADHPALISGNADPTALMTESADPTAVISADHLKPSADERAPEGANGTDRHAGGGSAKRATARRLTRGLDHRLRGLDGEPTNSVLATSARTDRRQQQRRQRFLAKIVLFVVVAGLAVLLLQAFVIQPFSVPGNAMAPTLQAGDRILVLKSGLLEGPIRTGDIVVFHPPRSLRCTVVPGRTGDLVRRVVALPGDVIWSVGQTIFVNGRPLRERGWYDRRFGQLGSTPIRSTTLGARQYFVMADNRSDGCDSRAFGPISKSSVVGESVAVVGRHGHVFLGTL